MSKSFAVGTRVEITGYDVEVIKKLKGMDQGAFAGVVVPVPEIYKNDEWANSKDITWVIQDCEKNGFETWSKTDLLVLETI